MGYPGTEVSGYWGPPTATIDWCEENYVVSYYVAEWANTVSNAWFVALALYQLYSVRRHGLERRFALTAAGFAAVGAGSWAFHMTLRYGCQLLDELPMVYVTCVPAWSVAGELGRGRWAAAVLAAVAAALTWGYLCVYTDPFLHELVYAAVTGYVVVCAGYLGRTRVRDAGARRGLAQCMAVGVGLFVAAYGLWQLDVHCCAVWVRVRRQYLGLPLGLLLELHAWWHVLTASGVYCVCVYLMYLRQLLHGREEEFQLVWRWRVLPELTRRGRRVRANYSLGLLGPYAGRARAD
ncbi:AaceriAGR199Wp [[Ashbya] aceris (nom. inval.)]|nr:AaceriAGR199Wp [[Ashbya] aceris (nom. inval.)]